MTVKPHSAIHSSLLKAQAQEFWLPLVLLHANERLRQISESVPLFTNTAGAVTSSLITACMQFYWTGISAITSGSII